MITPGLLRFIFVLSCATVYTSCSIRSVYVPTEINTQLFDEKKQLQLNGYIGTNHAEVQAAGNPVNHLTLGLNTSLGTGLSIYEGFAGLYGYSKDNKRWRYELDAGAGANNNLLKRERVWFSIFKEEQSNYITESVYNKYFIQPSLGYFNKMEIYKIDYSFSISCRTSYINFNKYIYREVNEDSTLLTGQNVYVVNKEFFNKDLYLIEPCITNKVRLKNVSAVLQGQFMIPYSARIDIRHTKFSPVFVFALGLQYNLIFRKTKKPTEA
ncbi:MAG: hypothetical protein ACJ77K_16485 [Bacteroidia bacterium]